MLFESEYYCPECDEGIDLPEPQFRKRERSQSRRAFLGTVGAGAAVVAGAGTRTLSAKDVAKKPAKPAEGLIRELYDTFTPEQKKQFALPWDHGQNGKLTRLATFNRPILGKRLGQEFSKSQQDLIKRTLRSILANDEALERISRHGTWDGSKSFEGCGCAIFGEPSDDKKFAWVFSGHHLTLRCDGNSVPGAAFGGPVYYGHSANGYSKRNVYNYQTEKVQAVFDALDAKQQEKAIADRNPGDRDRGIRFPTKGSEQPGIGYDELSKDQQQLVENVMRTLLEPFRKEDGDEVMEIIKANGGMDEIHLAFYKDGSSKDEQLKWHFWRLEGPGFIWNYRVLPHVHCYVNIVNA